MPQFQPQPMVVIRHELLAFFALHLLGSCAPMPKVEAPTAVIAPCCQQWSTASKVSSHQTTDIALTFPTC